MVTGASSALSLDRGASPARIPWTTVLVCVAASVAVLFAAWTVRQYKLGKRKHMDPLRAVRTAMLAQACAYAGALLGGSYGAYALVLARDWSQEPRKELAVATGVAALGGVVMVVAGGVAEWWCRIGPMDDDDKQAERPDLGVAH